MAPSYRISIKNDEEIAILREAGGILASIIRELKSSLKVGMTTGDIDALAEKLISEKKVKAAFKGYRGYPATACVSINEEVVHGIPSERRIYDGDIVSVDMGIIYKGYYSDTAFSAGVGNITPLQKKLLKVTEESLMKGIAQARKGNFLSDISHAVQKHVEANGFSVVREFVGHGIGRVLHEDPEIPNFGQPHQGPELQKGMVFCIEPMVNMGGWQTKILNDGWTVVTLDGKPSAHFEHTIAITDEGPSILTI
jgi:methionyl aminopeptidase